MEHSLFEISEVTEILSPVVLSVPHSGQIVPEERHELMMLPRETFFRDIDFEVQKIWTGAALKIGIPVIRALVHRYAIDLNRRLDQVDASMIAGHPRPVGTEKRGLFWTRSTQDEELGHGGGAFRPLAPKVAKSLIDLVWRPYYAWIQARMLAAKEKFGFAVLIDAHSMPAQGSAFHDDPAQKRHDIVPGNLFNRSCHSRISDLSIACAKELGFSVAANEPYAGGGLTQHFSKLVPGTHALQIEMNRSLYMDENSKELREEGLERFSEYAYRLLEKLTALKISDLA